MIRCIKFHPYEKNTLRGFADLELTHVGIILRDCSLHQKDDEQWVSFPARSYVGNDGVTHYQPMIEFVAGAKEAREQFQRQALKAIELFNKQTPEPAS
jgi:hypothetical protein